MNSFEIRAAQEGDCQTIVDMMFELACYEKIEAQFAGDSDLLYNALFVNKDAEVVMVEENNNCVGYALFFHNFSTFKCKKGLYLEDLYIKPEYRGKGYGKAVLYHLIDLAKQRDCGRMEWVVLNWNKQAIDTYDSLGASSVPGWTTYRIDNSKFLELIK